MRASILLFAILLCSVRCEEGVITINLEEDYLGRRLSQDKSEPIDDARIPEFIARLRNSAQFSETDTQIALIKAGSRAVPELRRALDEKDATVRCAIMETLGRIGPAAKDAIPDLFGDLKAPDDMARYAAHRALVRIGAPAVRPLLDAIGKAPMRPIGIADENRVSKNTLIEILGEIGAPAADATPQLFAMLEELGEMQDGDAHHNLREDIKTALRTIGQHAPRIADFLRTKLNAPLLSARYAAALTLVHMRQYVHESLPILFVVMRNRPLKYIAWSNVLNLLEFSSAELPELAAGLKDDDPWIRDTVLGAYLRAAHLKRGARDIPQIISMLNDPEPTVQLTAAETLGEYGDLAAAAAVPLRKMLKSNIEAFLRVGVIHAFQNLGKYAPGIEIELCEILKASHFEPTKIAVTTPPDQMKIPDQSGIDHTDEVRKACVETLFVLKPAGPEILKQMLHDTDPNTRKLGVWAMSELKHRGRYALADVKELTNDPEPSVQMASLQAISILDPELYNKLKRPEPALIPQPPAMPSTPPATKEF